ncbi:hypothetical protein PBY51_022720 [Eleginops maclovinus]|uniref:Uncharacterized protein n=1 Tax=Eleginops maclovinus TaxID=56733 RepID=A0AAN8AIL0_ELEMC|nr:hypothetical protein PBY51_022720 [Eleginops maclovinus]
MKRMRERERRKKRALKVRGSEDMVLIEGEFKAVDSVWLSNPLIPGLWSGIEGAMEEADPSLSPLSVKAPP